MTIFFLERGYPEGLINHGIAKAKSIPQSTLRQVKPKEKSDVLPFVFTHNPHNPNLVPIVKSTLDILGTNPRMNKVLASTKYITSRRQPSNLSKLLTRASFTMSTTTRSDGGSRKCGDKRCGTCPHIQETASIKITTTGREFSIKAPMNYKTKNVLYIITCQGCKEQYVGMTDDVLASRVRVHKQHINHPVYRKLGVSKHIDECCINEPKFIITPFLFIFNFFNLCNG